ncbi:hypothetical protein [Acinetobacter sp.]
MPTSSDIITKILGGFAIKAVESKAPPAKAIEREIIFLRMVFSLTDF